MLSPNDHDYYKIIYCTILYIQSHNCISNIFCHSFLYESCVSIKFISSSSFFFSTETALIKVQNDIRCWLMSNFADVGSLCRIDTIDHDIRLSRLCNVYGITGDALDWFRSYLIGRIQRVVIEDAVSGDQELGFVVPQVFVLGTKIYCMYTKPVSDIIQRHGLSHHSYAVIYDNGSFQQ